jgi:phosphate transport system substrate-binding protein
MRDGEVCVGLLPTPAGSFVLAYNLPGFSGDLKLSRDAYAGIFLGTVKTWNDAKIAAANPGVQLPATPITPVTRSDGSGTTFVFTNHLSAISEAWKSGPGAGTTINWPAGVSGKGNAGVTALIKQTPGAIGYVEYGYAKQTGMPMVTLQNKSGKYVKADPASEQAALAGVEMPPNLRVWVPDPAGADAYPIVTYTWLLCYKKYAKPEVAATLKAVIKYGLTEGQKFSDELGYIPLPAAVASQVGAAAGQITP